MAKEFTELAHALRNLRRRPARSAVLVAAIALLVAGLVFAASAVRRVEAGVRRAADRLGADLLVVPAGSRGAAEDVLLDSAVKTFYMDGSVADRVRALKGVARVTTQTYLATIPGGCCDVPETIVVAFDPETDFVVSPWLEGHLGRRLGPGEAVVGAESAFNIRVGLTQVDGRIFGKVFRIAGVLDRTGTGLDTAIFVDARGAGELLRRSPAKPPPGAVSIVFARVEDGVDPARVADAIEDTILEADGVARRDVGQRVLRALAAVGRVILVALGLGALLAGALTWAVFSGVATERVREVGLMRAIGAAESHVVRLFLLEVVLVGAIGSALGALGGTGLSAVLTRELGALQAPTAALGAAERLAIAALGVLAGTGVCVLGALSPIRATRRTDPLVVLKGD